ncbi:hypothetical protein TSOC_006476, partial [Tetrabaena socialis]
ALARGLSDTGLVDFCCIYLVHPNRGTFGAVAISGEGSELYPPLLSHEAVRNTARLAEVGASPALNVFTRSVFQPPPTARVLARAPTAAAPAAAAAAARAAASSCGLPLDARCTAPQGHAAPEGVMELLRAEQQRRRLPAAAAAAAAASSLLLDSRVLSRSLSCVEFSGAIRALDLAEPDAASRHAGSDGAGVGTLATYGGPRQQLHVGATKCRGMLARQPAAAAAADVTAAVPCRSASRSPAAPSHRADGSDSGTAFMLDSAASLDLPVGGFMMSPPACASSHGAFLRGAPLEPSVGPASLSPAGVAAAASGSRANTMSAMAAALAAARGSSTCATDFSVGGGGGGGGGRNSWTAWTSANHHHGNGPSPYSTAGRSEAANASTSEAGLSDAGRWSRDSAAAAAAVWSMEAAEAFEAAVQFTSGQHARGGAMSSSRSAAPPPSASAMVGVCGARGGLYGIAESVQGGGSGGLSMVDSFSNCGSGSGDDFGITLYDEDCTMAAAAAAGAGENAGMQYSASKGVASGGAASGGGASAHAKQLQQEFWMTGATHQQSAVRV